MKGKLVRTTTATTTVIKGHTVATHQLHGRWQKVNNHGQPLQQFARLGTQNGFFAYHKQAGTVFAVPSGEYQGFWVKMETDPV